MYETLKLFCQPYLPLMIIIGAAVFSARGAGRLTGRRFGVIASAWAALLILSVPVVGYFLAGSLERRGSPVTEIRERPAAIVVLGGGLLPKAGDLPEAELNSSSYKRVLHGWRLYRQYGPCPVIVCGGATGRGDTESTEAGVMRDFLVRLGVAPADIHVEGQSRSTFENARCAARVLRENGWERPLLVTEALHMPRALRCFTKQRVAPIPAPCGFRSAALPGSLSGWLVPNAETLDLCQSVVNEWVGLGYYRLTGRI